MRELGITYDSLAVRSEFGGAVGEVRGGADDLALEYIGKVASGECETAQWQLWLDCRWRLVLSLHGRRAAAETATG